MTYTKADLLLLWTCFKEEAGRYGWFAVAAQRYYWEEPREGTGRRKQTKKCTPGNQQAGTQQELCSRPVARIKVQQDIIHFSIKEKAMLRGLPGQAWRSETCLGSQESTNSTQRVCWGIRSNRRGQHQVELRTTQMHTADNLPHMFLLHTQATKKREMREVV